MVRNLSPKIYFPKNRTFSTTFIHNIHIFIHNSVTMIIVIFRDISTEVGFYSQIIIHIKIIYPSNPLYSGICRYIYNICKNVHVTLYPLLLQQNKFFYVFIQAVDNFCECLSDYPNFSPGIAFKSIPDLFPLMYSKYAAQPIIAALSVHKTSAGYITSNLCFAASFFISHLS